MTDTRRRILERIESALADVPADETPQDVPVPRNYLRADTEAGRGLVDVFAERAADYRARVELTTDSTAPAVIAGLLADHGVTTVVTPPGLAALYLSGAAGADFSQLHDDPPLSVDALDAAQGVISGCALAIAETGTIILDGGAGQGRRALTLLPDYHLCLVRTDQIVATVPDAISRLDPRRPLTMISGPSATSDIENNRVEGVHGPRTLHILIIEPDRETE
jgi:L-lactate dehydrogenase complex protein LldG